MTLWATSVHQIVCLHHSLFSPSSLLVIAVLFTGPSRWKSVKWLFGSHFGSPSVRESCWHRRTWIVSNLSVLSKLVFEWVGARKSFLLSSRSVRESELNTNSQQKQMYPSVVEELLRPWVAWVRDQFLDGFQLFHAHLYVVHGMINGITC